MKYHAGFKFLAFLLAAVTLVATLGSALGIFALGQGGFYATDMVIWKESYVEEKAMELASRLLDRYTARELGRCNLEQLQHVGRAYTDTELSLLLSLDSQLWDYSITDEQGSIADATASPQTVDGTRTYSFRMTAEYPLHVPVDRVDEYDLSAAHYRDYYYTDTQEHFLYYFTSPVYTVTVRMMPGAIVSYDGLTLQTVGQLFFLRDWIIAVLAVSLLLLAVCATYLCCAAGHSPGRKDVRVVGLNRLPLDLYAAVTCLGCLGLTTLTVWILDITYDSTALNIKSLVLPGAVMLVAATLVWGFFYAAAAQIKVKQAYWWHHSIIGWTLGKLGRGIAFCFRGLRRLFRLLPLIWQWLLTAFVMVAAPGMNLLLAAISHNLTRGFFLFVTFSLCVADVAMVCYGAYAYGLLLKGAKQMAGGQLSAKIPTRHLFGIFRDFATQLNALSDTATLAAQNQMRSERMKTELITNVSHDIKTPLTSIINYVDLLQKPHSEEEGVQYLEVLSRQSGRLKKLIDDLMDMSKASTGNMSVELARLDAAETLNQALGEFADKLEQAALTPVFRQPETPIALLADGRLTWRVLSNLLSNIVKYALPGTRVYADLTQVDDRVLISLKNISAEPLNVSARELTERFVRGDVSRNTEGSGLGLNIAQSLMELQGGRLELLIDGDLFKVTLTFPAA